MEFSTVALAVAAIIMGFVYLQRRRARLTREED
jgi:hypothetical protein